MRRRPLSASTDEGPEAMTNTLTIAAAALVAVLAVPASAKSIAVPYGDLDLSAAEGRATLDKRITAAARKVCPTIDGLELRAQMAAKACYRVALASAQPQLAAATARRSRAAA